MSVDPKKNDHRQQRKPAAKDGAVYRSRVGAHRREVDPLLGALITLRAGATLRALGYK